MRRVVRAMRSRTKTSWQFGEGKRQLGEENLEKVQEGGGSQWFGTHPPFGMHSRLAAALLKAT
jgi:hypothetical protein